MFETAVMVAVVDVLCNSLISEEHNYLFIINKCNVTSSKTYTGISMENHYAQKVISVYQYIYIFVIVLLHHTPLY